jgi:hypothetical protein
LPSSLAEIRTALKATVSQFGLQVYDTVPDVTNSPACVVQPAPKNTAVFTGAMRMGGDEYRFDLLILVAATDLRNAQHILDEYITGQGDKSIRQLLFLNCSLGLDDVDAMAESVQGYNGSPVVAGTKMIGAIMRVCVTVT